MDAFSINFVYFPCTIDTIFRFDLTNVKRFFDTIFFQHMVFNVEKNDSEQNLGRFLYNLELEKNDGDP